MSARMLAEDLPAGEAPAVCDRQATEPAPEVIIFALAAALMFVVLTRWPVARLVPYESDEVGFLQVIGGHWFPSCHTLYLAVGRLFGEWTGSPYQGLVVTNLATEAVALAAAWWWLRALVAPATAAVATFLLGVSPVFWAYGAMAGNYPGIIAAGSVLLGIAARGHRDPRPWHPFAAAAVLALGAGYRQDIGLFWLAPFLLILRQHRWTRSLGALALFVALNVAWVAPMLVEVGGLDGYRAANAAFSYNAGYLNSAWNLGLVDATLRYGVKLLMTLAWTLGPALLLIPRGGGRLRDYEGGPYLLALLAASILPALGFHLLVHFGSPGYAFHYVPALLALVALGAGAAPVTGAGLAMFRRAPARLAAIAALLAAIFWFYPTDYNRPGFRGDFDLAFARQTRRGLSLAMPARQPSAWRTANSRVHPDNSPIAHAEQPADESRAN